MTWRSRFAGAFRYPALGFSSKILGTHTAALDTLLTRRKGKEDEKPVSADRFDRLEHWAQLVGQKLGIKLEL